MRASCRPALFDQVNRGNASITLDLKDADNVAAFNRLLADADVLIESFRRGGMDRLGCGYETLKQINPRLVYAALTGYGQTGPLRDAAGHDVNYLALAGVLDQMGRPGGPSVMANVQIADLAGGALTWRSACSSPSSLRVCSRLSRRSPTTRIPVTAPRRRAIAAAGGIRCAVSGAL